MAPINMHHYAMHYIGMKYIDNSLISSVRWIHYFNFIVHVYRISNDEYILMCSKNHSV